MRRLLCILVVLAWLPHAASAQFGANQYMQVGGMVLTSRGQPIPGCIVQLFNPDLGPSVPTSTGATGEYYFSLVPTNVRSLYTIRVTWSGAVIYNGIIRHPGIQEPIVIPVP